MAVPRDTILLGSLRQNALKCQSVSRGDTRLSDSVITEPIRLDAQASVSPRSDQAVVRPFRPPEDSPPVGQPDAIPPHSPFKVQGSTWDVRCSPPGTQKVTPGSQTPPLSSVFGSARPWRQAD